MLRRRALSSMPWRVRCDDLMALGKQPGEMAGAGTDVGDQARGRVGRRPQECSRFAAIDGGGEQGLEPGPVADASSKDFAHN